ncbi:MAG: Crp/Fnr family transcriptional regulator [Clostridiales bacterium]|nr:Crp/Fnr family transcriptional regulator [Clostridiales bacterium]
MYEKWMDVLSQTTLFESILFEDLKPMIECIRPKLMRFKKNNYIVIAGDDFDGVGILLEGTATVIKENAAGDRMIMSLLEPGDMFGEMAAFSNSKRWPATVQSQDDCVVIFVPGDKIVGTCENSCYGHKQLILNMLKIISEKALHLNKKVEYLTIKSMRGKISAFLLEQYKKAGKNTFMLTLNRNELADFLNVSRPSMSREMSRMRDEGIIDYYMSSVRIKDMDALKRAIE